MCLTAHRKSCLSDASDEERSRVVPYLALMTQAAPQRAPSLRELFNALRTVIRCGTAWRAMPNDLLSWAAVYQQSRRRLAAGCFEALAQDLRALLRLASGRVEEPTPSSCRKPGAAPSCCRGAGSWNDPWLGHTVPSPGQGPRTSRLNTRRLPRRRCAGYRPKHDTDLMRNA